MQKGHLEVFYFTQPYGSTRWETWAILSALGDCNAPSALRNRALLTATRCLPTVDQKFHYPSDLSQQTMNKFITATHQGEDRQKHTCALLDARDWTGVTLLDSPELPPIFPVACQNLLTNFRTDNSANASVVLSSTLIAARGPVTLRPNATFLRFLLLPQTANTFDVVDGNVSWTGPMNGHPSQL